MSLPKFSFFVERPAFPVIVISTKGLNAAFDTRQLEKFCKMAEPAAEGEDIKSIDSSGMTFTYLSDQNLFCPDIMGKVWSKKAIIELYNSTLSEDSDATYSLKSLSSKKTVKIVADICEKLKQGSK